MSAIIRIRDIWMLSMNGKYVEEYDPSRPGGLLIPEELPTSVHIVVTDDVRRAKKFATCREALEYCRGPLSTVGRTIEVAVNGKYSQ